MRDYKKNNILSALKWLTLGGLSGAAVSAVTHKIHNNRIDKEVDSILGSSDVDENTLVLTIPKEKLKEYKAKRRSKTASAYTDVKNFPETAGKTYMIDKSISTGARSNDGKFTSNSCIDRSCGINKTSAAFSSNMWGSTASILAAIAGTAAGYKIVSKIMSDRKLAELESIAEKERHEYLDQIVKASSSLTKEAGLAYSISDLIRGKPNMVSNGLGITLAALIVGALGVGGITSSYLKKTKNNKDATKLLAESSEMPQIERVIFKSSSSEDVITSPKACIACALDMVNTMKTLGDKTASVDESYFSDASIRNRLLKFASNEAICNDIINNNHELLKAAGFASMISSGGLSEFLANRTLLDDNRNSEILEKLEDMSTQVNKANKKSKKKSKKSVKIEVDGVDPDLLAYVLKNKSDISKAVNKLGD